MLAVFFILTLFCVSSYSQEKDNLEIELNLSNKMMFEESYSNWKLFHRKRMESLKTNGSVTLIRKKIKITDKNGVYYLNDNCPDLSSYSSAALVQITIFITNAKQFELWAFHGSIPNLSLSELKQKTEEILPKTKKYPDAFSATIILDKNFEYFGLYAKLIRYYNSKLKCLDLGF